MVDGDRLYRQDHPGGFRDPSLWISSVDHVVNHLHTYLGINNYKDGIYLQQESKNMQEKDIKQDEVEKTEFQQAHSEILNKAGL